MKGPLAMPVDIRHEQPVKPESETVVEIKTKPENVVAEENESGNDKENHSFFEKSVASTSVSTVINDIADEL